MNFDVTELHRPRQEMARAAANVILQSLPEAKGKILPEQTEVSIVAAWPDYKILAIAVIFRGDIVVTMYFYGAYSRDGFYDSLFLSRVKTGTWKKEDRPAEIELDTSKLGRMKGVHFPPVVTGDERKDALKSAQLVGLLPVK